MKSSDTKLVILSLRRVHFVPTSDIVQLSETSNSVLISFPRSPRDLHKRQIKLRSQGANYPSSALTFDKVNIYSECLQCET